MSYTIYLSNFCCCCCFFSFFFLFFHIYYFVLFNVHARISYLFLAIFFPSLFLSLDQKVSFLSTWFRSCFFREFGIGTKKTPISIVIISWKPQNIHHNFQKRDNNFNFDSAICTMKTRTKWKKWNAIEGKEKIVEGNDITVVAIIKFYEFFMQIHNDC